MCYMTRIFDFRLLISISILLCAANTVLARDSTSEVLDQVREKIGWEESQSRGYGIQVDGSGEALGLNSKFSFHFFKDGQFRLLVDSKLGSIKGYDGRSGWQVDYTGMPYDLEYYELEVTKVMAWVIGGYWLDPDCPVNLKLLPDIANASTIRISAITHKGYVEFTIHLNRHSYLPEKLTWQIFSDENFIEFELYEQMGFFFFPQHIVRYEEGEVTDIHVISIKKVLEVSSSQILTPPKTPLDTDFMGATSPIVESSLGAHGLLLRATVERKTDVWFFLDCGANCNTVDATLARSHGMEVLGKGITMGVGGAIDHNYFQANQITVGPLVVTNPVFVSGNHGYDSGSNGDKLGGILGFDLLSRCLLEIDISDQSVKIYDPAKYENMDIAWHELIFVNGLPLIMCSLSTGHQGVFMLDTGFSGSVLLNTAFVRKHNLLAGRELNKTYMVGAGGGFTAFQSHIDWFEIGGNRIQEPEIVFADSEEGFSSHKLTAGLVGRGILLQFKTLVFDYPNKRIGFQY